MYFAVIGDMIGSRTLSDRQSAQNCLKKALEEVNRFYSDSQASLFGIKYRYGTAGEYYQKEIADKLGISPQMVSSRMKNTGLATYISARQNIGKMLQKQWGDQHEEEST